MPIFLWTFIPLAGMLCGLPLLGVWLAGLPLDPFFEFPPQTRYVRPPPFLWAAFAALAALTAVALMPLIARGVASYRQNPAPASPGRRPFPWWGWLGLGAGLAAWALAWTRFPWMADLQPHTFTPLWLAYIVVVNALCHCRTGRSLLTHSPVFLLALFPASAVFWWFFEYLNRFVQNWYYTAAAFSPWEYFWYATLPFATVLPAVISTRELLRSQVWLQRAFGRTRPLPGCWPRATAGGLLAVACAGLAGIGVWPSLLFPLLWVAPLMILVGLRSIRGESHPLADLGGADWTAPVSAALAALVCGFFWEMWNFWSLARWEYSIPFVQRFMIFEMPLLGYAGYLPFGLECAAVAELIEDLLKSNTAHKAGGVAF